eukprot:941373-Lingulodinium_polyedra.AAC.1
MTPGRTRPAQARRAPRADRSWHQLQRRLSPPKPPAMRGAEAWHARWRPRPVSRRFRGRSLRIFGITQVGLARSTESSRT